MVLLYALEAMKVGHAGLIVSLLALLGTSGCGGADKRGTTPVAALSPGSLVAHVDQVPITAGMLTHWMTVIAPEEVPDPPNYKSCISAVRASGKSRPTSETARGECELKYRTLQQKALEWLIVAHWFLAESERLGQPVSEQEVTAALAREDREDYPGGQAEFQEFLQQSGQDEADVRLKLASRLAAERVHRHLASSEAPVTEQEIEVYYRHHMASFVIPDLRKIVIVERYKKPQAEKAKREIEHGRSIKTLEPLYETIARYAKVGVPGGEAAERAIFQAPLHVLLGPVRLPASWSDFVVTKAIPARLRPLATVRAKIESTLRRQEQKQDLQRFVEEWVARWSTVTTCAKAALVPPCSEYHGPHMPPAEDPFALV